ncbi:MAG: DUF4956 domain-containing protein [Clostridiales Family XIII bacterium]|jgi:hypothetical protein|nr:DUF4956 domain-containing protein [Clostridiales Family XIII bacterium]
MLDRLTGSVIGAQLTLSGVLLCTAASIVFGLCIACIHMLKGRYNKNFVVALALLPPMVQIVIMLVNGNIGAGIAVAGAFSLVRFRSIPGSAGDIGSIFFAMAIGFVTGMGYLFYGLVFLALIGAAHCALSFSRFGNGDPDTRILKIVIPENLDYDGLFDDLFLTYTDSATLDRVKTVSMGSLYELTYSVRLKSPAVPKAFIDALRCRNGNLNISLSREQTSADAL